jgi:hypothetical protein
VLQPSEEGAVEVNLDTRRFAGPKTVSLYLTLEYGTTITTPLTVTPCVPEGVLVYKRNARTTTTTFIITADAQESVPPP